MADESSDGAGAAPAGDGQSPDQLAQDALRAAREAIAGLNDMAGEAVAQAQDAARTDPAAGAAAFTMPTFDASAKASGAKGIDLLSDVTLNVRIELGRTRMLVEDVLKLGEGAVVELEKLAGDPVDVYVNDRHVARGEVLVLNDNFCVRINEIVAQGPEAGKGSAA
jgi:flagellar motor switch protein FliN/FliY